MKRDLFAPIRNLLSLPSRKELPYLCLLIEETYSLPLGISYQELPYLCLLNEEGPIRSH